MLKSCRTVIQQYALLLLLFTLHFFLLFCMILSLTILKYAWINIECDGIFSSCNLLVCSFNVVLFMVIILFTYENACQCHNSEIHITSDTMATLQDQCTFIRHLKLREFYPYNVSELFFPTCNL